MIKICTTAIIVMILAVSPASAAKPHMHGHSKLNIAIEDTTMEMELAAPGADIIGFEHAANSEADKAKLMATYALFKTPQQLFRLSSAAVCKVVHTDVNFTNDPHHGDHAGHEDHEDHAGHEEHDEGHADGHNHSHETGEHGEFHAHYKFTCANTSALTAIRVGDYFKKFEGAQVLTVNIITAKGQRSYDASRDEPVIDLSELN